MEEFLNKWVQKTTKNDHIEIVFLKTELNEHNQKNNKDNTNNTEINSSKPFCWNSVEALEKLNTFRNKLNPSIQYSFIERIIYKNQYYDTIYKYSTPNNYERIENIEKNYTYSIYQYLVKINDIEYNIDNYQYIFKTYDEIKNAPVSVTVSDDIQLKDKYEIIDLNISNLFTIRFQKSEKLNTYSIRIIISHPQNIDKLLNNINLIL